jgi:cephalosporin hydroxylase
LLAGYPVHVDDASSTSRRENPVMESTTPNRRTTLTGALRKVGARFYKAIEERRFSGFHEIYNFDASFTHAVSRFCDSNSMYGYAHQYFRTRCPREVREHRSFFKKERRGFGEDALHAMWWLLLREFKPTTCLEIGVYRGQVISLWSLIARSVGFRCDVHGISPFTSAGDAVSWYPDGRDYLEDTLQSFRRLGLPGPNLLRALSTEAAAASYVSARRWDLIYIDGNHDYEVVLQDYRLCRDHLSTGGLLVLDDSSLGTDYQPPAFAFAGHPGPSRVCREVVMRELSFVGRVGHNTVFAKP